MVLADEDEAVARLARERRAQPRRQQPVVELRGIDEAEAADDEIAVVDLQCPTRSLAIGRRRETPRLRDSAPLIAGVAMPRRRHAERFVGMNDDAVGVLDDARVAGISIDRCCAAQRGIGDECGIPVRFEQSRPERPRRKPRLVHPVQHAAEKEIVEHDRSGQPLEQVEHPLMRRRVSELVEHALAAIRIRFEPLDRSDRPRRHVARQFHGRLPRDELDVVVACQIRQQLAAVRGDSRSLGRQRRHVRKRGTLLRKPARVGAAMLGLAAPALNALLHGVQCTARRRAPGEPRGLAQAVRLQLGSKRAIGQHGMNLCRRRVDVRRIEERIASSNDLGNARRVGPHDGGAARHRFQRGQSEAFLERREARHRAVAVERSEIRVGQPSRKQHVGGVQSLVRAQQREGARARRDRRRRRGRADIPSEGPTEAGHTPRSGSQRFSARRNRRHGERTVA